MNPVLARWNSLDASAAAREVLPCCGSQAWADLLSARRPIADADALLATSSAVWWSLPEADWLQAFNSHPRLGQTKAIAHATPQSLEWSAQEQQQALSDITADTAAKTALAEANLLYEQRFGRIFLLCATGKSSTQILSLLKSRLHNDTATELRESADQQRQITELRLQRWLEGN